MERQRQKPKAPTPQESWDVKRNDAIENKEVGKRESQPKTQQTATQGQTTTSPTMAELKQKLADLKAQTPTQQQQTQQTPNQQKLATLKQSVPQTSRSTPTAQPPSASI